MRSNHSFELGVPAPVGSRPIKPSNAALLGFRTESGCILLSHLYRTVGVNTQNTRKQAGQTFCLTASKRETLFRTMFCCCLVSQLCLTFCDPMNFSPPGSSVHRNSLGKNAGSGLPFPSPGDPLHPGIEPRFPALAGIFSTTEPPRKPTIYSGKYYLQFCINKIPKIWFQIPIKLKRGKNTKRGPTV